MSRGALTAAATLTVRPAVSTPCRRSTCGHAAERHQHYNYGDYCGTCSCPSYQAPLIRPAAWLLRFLRRTG